MGAWLATRFANPGALALGALVAVPIIIWLFNRYRYKNVEWAAMEFLLRALKKNQRRLQLENLLLLLLRCLAILLFVLALSRPRAPLDEAAPVDEDGNVRRNVVLVVDTSWSMGHRVGAETVFERAHVAAREILRSLKAGDRVALVEASDGAKAIHVSPRTLDEKGGQISLFKDLDDIRLSSRTGEASPVLRQLPALCRRFDAGTDGGAGAGPRSAKTVYFITDAQRGAWLDAQGALRDPALTTTLAELEKENARLAIVDVGDDDAQNVGVTEIAVTESVVAELVPVRFEVRVKNWSKTQVQGLQLEYYVDEVPGPNREASPRLTTSVDLGPNEERLYNTFVHAFEGLGPHRVQVRLVSDALDVDNRRSLIVDVRESIRVLLVDGQASTIPWESETDFLRTSLEPDDDPLRAGALFQPVVRSDHELPDVELSEYDVVVLANVAAPPAEQVAALERFVREGGAVVLFLGDNVDGPEYNARLFRDGDGLLPIALTEPRGYEGDTDDPDVPAYYAYLAGSAEGPLEVFHDDELRPLLRFSNFFKFFGTREPEEGAQPPAGEPGIVRARLVKRPAEETPGALPSVSEIEATAGKGPALLIERPYGRGKVAMITSTADGAWTTLPVEFAWPVMIPQLFAYLVEERGSRRNLQIGDLYEATVPPEQFVPRVEIRTPTGDEVDEPLSRIDDGQRFRLEYLDTEDAGIYEVVYSGSDRRAEGAGGEEPPVAPPGGEGGGGGEDAPAAAPDHVDYFAVNVVAAEGDLTRMSRDDLRAVIGSLPVRWTTQTELEQVLRGPGRGATGIEYWWPVVLAVMLVLLGESAIGMIFERLRR